MRNKWERKYMHDLSAQFGAQLSASETSLAVASQNHMHRK